MKLKKMGTRYGCNVKLPSLNKSTIYSEGELIGIRSIIGCTTPGKKRNRIKPSAANIATFTKSAPVFKIKRKPMMTINPTISHPKMSEERKKSLTLSINQSVLNQRIDASAFEFPLKLER